MAEIKVMIDGEEYTKEQFRKDTIRMFDKYRCDSNHMGEMNCRNIYCGNCPLNNEECDSRRGSLGIKSFETIKFIYEWSQENPIITNKDMLKKTFGKDVIHYIETRPYKEKWLDEEYKEPTKEEND